MIKENIPPNVRLIDNTMYSLLSKTPDFVFRVKTYVHPNGILEFNFSSSKSTYIAKSLKQFFNDYFDYFKEEGYIEDVSVTGITSNLSTGPGSSRFSTVSPNLSGLLQKVLETSGLITELNTIGIGEYVKVADYFRFMKYSSGGQHFPHYDSDYIFPASPEFKTRYSLVMYHEESEDGELYFCHEPRGPLRTDWDRQANDSEIYLKIKPGPLKIVIFPHTLCHGVLPYSGKERNIIRGDLIFKN